MVDNSAIISGVPPPKGLTDRTSKVEINLVNTIKSPCDPHDPNWSAWYDSGSGMLPVRHGNSVLELIDGHQTFRAMEDTILTAARGSDYIYILGWWMDLDLQLAKQSLRDILRNAVSQGVQVRVMLWDQFGKKNTAEVDEINRLDDGAAILDNNTLNIGSQHQKIVLVKGSQGLTGFCGGVDLNIDRVQHVDRQPGSPMHDVHCKIQGPAAWDLLQIFVQRWSDHPQSLKLESQSTRSNPKPQPVPQLRAIIPRPDARVPEPNPQIVEPVPDPVGRLHVQIGRTFGNGSRHRGITNVRGQRFYSFAPNGEQTAQRLVFHAIAQAEQFIYMEDQYLISMDASTALRNQLPKIQRLIILIAHSSISDLPGVWDRRKAFIDNLKRDPATRDKVVVCYRKPADVAANPKKVDDGSIHSYVHAKMYIMDDKFAVIGSANCNNRGFTHDSEVVAGIFDESSDDCSVYFAHQLRMRLWAHHLNLKRLDVFDPLGSAHHWISPSKSARVAVYDENADTGGSGQFTSWLAQTFVPGDVDPVGN